jgi:hypothetical protein
MNKMALDLIAEIMGWEEDDGTATREYAWLRLMSAVKYDGYADFRAGVRFLESLATWLKQFEVPDRPTAYEFVRRRLVYISPAELQRIIEAFVPEVVTPNLRHAVADELGIRPYEVWSAREGAAAFDRRMRTTLLVGMSDGSRIDVLRRANAGRLSTEQVVPMINIDNEKWRDLNEKLVDNLDSSAKFESVYLIDDFIGSGTTFIRRNSEGQWKGKLKKFNDLVLTARNELKHGFPLADGYTLHIHHYISSHQASEALDERIAEADGEWTEKSYGAAHVTEGLCLLKHVQLNADNDRAMLDLCDRYYDHSLFLGREKHCRQAKQIDMKLGYANCAPPVVLDHNTPNNSIPLLWAETEGKNGAHAMQPLFRRRDRHG